MYECIIYGYGNEKSYLFSILNMYKSMNQNNT